MPSGRPRASGIVLIILSGLVVLLLLTSILFLSFVRSQATGAAVAAALEGLAAASGMEYAAGRLLESPFPRHTAGPEGRQDDWTCREEEGKPLAEVSNPSYARGEPWMNGTSSDPDGFDNDGDLEADEAGEADRIRAASEPFRDLDGDGAFTPWSGRLRGAGSPHALRFLLRIASEGGKIPLNAGALDAISRDPDGPLPIPPNGTPDHRDPELAYHRGLAHVLNNLGSLLRPMAQGPWTRRYDFETGVPASRGDPMRHSQLGQDLIGSRPVGGYRSLAEVEGTLKAIGYRQDECDLLLPFLDLGPYGHILSTSGRELEINLWSFGNYEPVQSGFAYVPIEIAGASQVVLEAVWMYLRSNPRFSAFGMATVPAPSVSESVPCDLLTAEGDNHWRRYSVRSGGSGAGASAEYRNLSEMAVLYPDEAERIACLARSGPLVPKALFRALVDREVELFPSDWADMAGLPTVQRNRVRAKAELAFFAVGMDLPAWRSSGAWSHWGIGETLDRANPCGLLNPARRFSRVTHPSGVVWSPFSWPGVTGFFPYSGQPVSEMIEPQGLTFGPPSRFSIESLALHRQGGRLSRLGRSGTFFASERLELGSQEDFEGLGGYASFAARGLAVLPPPADAGGASLAAGRAVLPDPALPGIVLGSSGRLTPQVVSLPRVNASRDPALRFPRSYGALALAGRESGPLGAKWYWPLSENVDPVTGIPAYDGSSANDYLAEVVPYRDVPASPVPFPARLSSNTSLSVEAVMNSPWALRLYGSLSFLAPYLEFAYDNEGNGVDAEDYHMWKMTVEGWATLARKDNDQGAAELSVGGISSQFGGFTVNLQHRLDAADGSPGVLVWVQQGGGLYIPSATVIGSSAAASPAAIYYYDNSAVTHRGLGPFLTVPPHQTGIFHVALTVEWGQEGATPLDGNYTYRLYINGSNRRPDGTPMVGKSRTTGPCSLLFDRAYHPRLAAVGAPVSQQRQSFRAIGFDEIRMYDSVLSETDVGDRYALGRYVQPPKGLVADPAKIENPTYRSPRFELEGGSVGLAQWTGVSSPAVDGRVRTAVRLRTYDGKQDPLGTPALLPESGVLYRPPLGRARYLDYDVEFYSADPANADPAPLLETPFFESVWLTLRRPGRAPAWAAWAQN